MAEQLFEYLDLPKNLNWLDFETTELDAMLDEHFFGYLKAFFGLDEDSIGNFPLQTLFDQFDQEAIKFMSVNEAFLGNDPCKKQSAKMAFLLMPYYTKSKDRSKRSTFEPCQNGFKIDASTGYCYKIDSFGQSPYEGRMLCRGKYNGAEFLQFNNDLEVKGFIDWVVDNFPDTSRLEFYISAWKNKGGQFAKNGKYLAIQNQLDNQTFRIIQDLKASNGKSIELLIQNQ